MAQPEKTKNIPTVFIIFGATGDLMTKKIVPALFHLYLKNLLPKMFKIIGFSRRNINTVEFQEHVRKILTEHDGKDAASEEINRFINLFMYQQGNFDEITSYKTLAGTLGLTDKQWNVCSSKLFYLAVPPEYNKIIFEHLKSSGLTIPCGPDEGWTRVIVEKPFGKDLETAENLDSLLGKLFKEEQIFRIDHYLAKEMLQNILSFRFVNNLFEEVWNNKFIERIDIRLLENIGVEKRGAFYDGIGALRDVGQNHLLQMLALTTMEQPLNFDAEEVRSKRNDVISTLMPLNKEEIKKFTFRAQYEGYSGIKGVLDNSKTETYFKTVAYLSSPRWEGVPIVMESGKRLIRKKEIIVTFKHPSPCLCPAGIKEHYKNKVIFSLEPEESIKIQFWSKKPGLEFKMEEKTLKFLYRPMQEKTQYVEEYEKLLLDCITGNQLLFISTSEIKQMWKYIDPIIKEWQQDVITLHNYQPDTEFILKEANITSERLNQKNDLKKEIGIVGLGKMGGNIARRLKDKGWKVIAYNRTSDVTKEYENEGITGAYSFKDLIKNLSKPRTILMMLPAGKPIDDALFSQNGLINIVDNGDFIIDGANSFYEDTVHRSNLAEKQKIHYVDAGISGGPGGARTGASIMVGGKLKDFEYLKPLFDDMATDQGVQFFEGIGAGHFVKMVHNGIEYGMMQSIAEGFNLLKKSPYSLDLKRVAKIYSHGSVIVSRLVTWLIDSYHKYGLELNDVSGSVTHTGEGKWTVDTAKKLGVDVPVIKKSYKFRVESFKKPSYTGKILSALRNQFGGHDINKSQKSHVRQAQGKSKK